MNAKPTQPPAPTQSQNRLIKKITTMLPRITVKELTDLLDHCKFHYKRSRIEKLADKIRPRYEETLKAMTEKEFWKTGDRLKLKKDPNGRRSLLTQARLQILCSLIDEGFWP